jgi:hypothetical protein
MSNDRLIIIPCGAGKIWDNYPSHGPCKAKEAYTGSPFKVNRGFAEACAGKWMILSAKYGYIEPDFLIPGNYNVSFKDPMTLPVKADILIGQIRSQGLDKFGSVIGLGGKEYRQLILTSFAPFRIPVSFPFADRGLKIGETMSLINKVISLVRRDPNIIDKLDQVQ